MEWWGWLALGAVVVIAVGRSFLRSGGDEHLDEFEKLEDEYLDGLERLEEHLDKLEELENEYLGRLEKLEERVDKLEEPNAYNCGPAKPERMK